MAEQSLYERLRGVNAIAMAAPLLVSAHSRPSLPAAPHIGLGSIRLAVASIPACLYRDALPERRQSFPANLASSHGERRP